MDSSIQQFAEKKTLNKNQKDTGINPRVAAL